MSFSGSMNKARDATRPMARRASSLRSAIERFQLFGFEGTISALADATGAGDDGWSPAQLDVAIAMLDDAHHSWASFARAELEAGRATKRSQPGAHRPSQRDQLALWKQLYFSAERADQWHLTSEMRQSLRREG
ncbi:hypothetical protein AX769_05020 [Frondihabitans sp. PAMC 28766]|uniref:hypothetical protein n=1 Tax=Frondihabitans sp. PAMC 28766 TaxID=1795630 RepID=UPI00078D6AD8|nr:hypothetical protein [Frondihabitans sp. PAMC 28766]AMM19617.1 hypothetical protein AX769_05020 [Frondihabitans sp. PAMC 28766]